MKPDSSAFKQDDVNIIEQKTVFDGFFKVQQYTLQHRLFCGDWSGEIVRELFERGDAVAVLPYDPITDEVILVEQFRVGAQAAIQRNGDKSSPWLIECIAGMTELNEASRDVAIREAKEEAGIELTNVQSVMSYYTSPGGMSERIELFVATVDCRKVAGVYGLAEEDEDIRVRVVKREAAMKWLNQGKVDNATTIIALQWLQLNKDHLANSEQVTQEKTV